jgi:hypothetical protein
MDIENLLWLDIVAIISVPAATLLLTSLMGITIAAVLTAGLVYLDILTYRVLNSSNCATSD